jgi:hypothetical protein
VAQEDVREREQVKDPAPRFGGVVVGVEGGAQAKGTGALEEPGQARSQGILQKVRSDVQVAGLTEQTVRDVIGR